MGCFGIAVDRQSSAEPWPVTHLPFIVRVRVRTQRSAYGICGGPSDIGTGLAEDFGFPVLASSHQYSILECYLVTPLCSRSSLLRNWNTSHFGKGGECIDWLNYWRLLKETRRHGGGYTQGLIKLKINFIIRRYAFKHYYHYPLYIVKY
jgi:hypothetical protein